MSKYLLIAVTFLATNNLKAGDRLFSSAAATAAAGALVTPARLDRPAEITPTRPESRGCLAGLFRSTSPKNNSSVSPRDFDQGASTSPTLLTDRPVFQARHEAVDAYQATIEAVGWENTFDFEAMKILEELEKRAERSDSPSGFSDYSGE